MESDDGGFSFHGEGTLPEEPGSSLGPIYPDGGLVSRGSGSGDTVVASCLALPLDTLAACTGESNTEIDNEQLGTSSHSVKLFVCL